MKKFSIALTVALLGSSSLLAMEDITPPQLDENSSYINSAIDNYGNIYTLFSDGSLSNHRLGQLLKYDGTSWEILPSSQDDTGGDDNGSQYITTEDGSLLKSSMKFDSQNNLHILYQEVDTNDTASWQFLAYQKYNATNGVWAWGNNTVPGALFEWGLDLDISGYGDFLALDINSSDIPIIAYNDIDNANKVMVRFQNYNGTASDYSDDSFDSLGDPAVNGTEVDLVVDNDTPYLAYTDSTTNVLKVLKYENSTWSVVDDNVSNGNRASKIDLYKSESSLFLKYVDDDAVSDKNKVTKLRRYRALTVEENIQEVTTLKLLDSSSANYSLRGEDSNKLSISSSGLIKFSNSPDYESPSDSDTDNVYKITAIASNTLGNSTLDYEITVRNATELFTSISNAETNSVVESNEITFEEIANGSALSIVGGEYQLNKDGNWTSDNTTVDNDDNITVRLTSSSSYLTQTTATLTFADESRAFSVTTKAAPIVVTPISGVCGSSNGLSFTEAPNENLCGRGSAGSVTLTDGSYQWSCSGRDGGSSASCSAEEEIVVIPIDGVCGSANGLEFIKAPTVNLCSSGESSEVITTVSEYSWSCEGVDGGVEASCNATVKVDIPVEPTDPETPTDPEPTDPETPTNPEPTDPETPTEPEVPTQPKDPISDNGDFDEDPSDDDIDIVIIGDNGEETEEVINKKDTGKEIVVKEATDNNDSSKEFILELKDLNSSEVTQKRIEVANPNATSTATVNGYEIVSEKDEDNRSVKSKIELNENGTSVSSLVITDKESGEQKKAAVTSFNPDVETEVSEDGSITIKTESQEAKVNSDGTTEHKVVANGKETKAISSINNTITAILEDGTVQTKVKVSSDESTLTVAVDGKSDGSAIHLIKLVDSSGNEVITKAESQVPGAITTISEEGDVETTVTTESNASLKATATKDGFATHEVSINNKTTKASVALEGATTIIDSSGAVSTTVTTSQTLSNTELQSVESVIQTDTNGATVTWFSINGVNERTISEDTPLEAGADINVSTNSDGKLMFEIKTDVTRDLVIE